MSELNKLTAMQATAGLANADFSAEELMRSCLARVSKRDGDVRAWAYLNPDQALSAAIQADDRLRAGSDFGPLHGLPVGVKDIIDTADMPTENGSPLFEERRPNHDSAVVAALRAAGAVIMGKTVTTELANANPSKTRNPRDLAHSPGGSSSGSGASVADFQVPVALGTQTGGSVIRPASFNGIYGLKPTLGLIPRGGALLQSHTLDTIGVYGRCLEDLALITDCISAPEPADPYSYRGSRVSLLHALSSTQVAIPRLAFLETPAWNIADTETQTAITSLAASLGETCQKETLPAPFDEILDLHAAVFGAENAHYYGPFLDDRPDLLSDNLRGRMAEAMGLSARYYVRALLERNVIYQSLEHLLSRFDAILCLSSGGPAPRGFGTTGSPAFNSPWTYLGVPCISLPRMSVRGLPVGVQLVGLRGGEARLMRVAHWLDQRLDEQDGISQWSAVG